MYNSINERKLDDENVLRITQIPKEDTDGYPQNDYRLMLYLSSKTRVGQKFAAEICHLLSREKITDLFDTLDSREEFYKEQKELIDNHRSKVSRVIN